MSSLSKISDILSRILFLYSRIPSYHRIRKSKLSKQIHQRYSGRHLHNQAPTNHILSCPLVSNSDRASQVLRPLIFVLQSRSIAQILLFCMSPSCLSLSILTSWHIRTLKRLRKVHLLKHGQGLTIFSFIGGRSVHLCNRCQHHREMYH